jgi:phosphate transport system protein
MERHFHEQLGLVSAQLATMGTLVESRVRDAVAALSARAPDLAVRVATGDADVNEMEVALDDACFQALALQHPMASDLRLVRSVMKANTDLERVGDQAVNIAQAAISLVAQPPLAAQTDVLALARVALDMLHDSLMAFVERDAARARVVLERDDEADSRRDALFQTLLAQMGADPETIPQAQRLIQVARHLERIADHATNIAENLIFVVEGRDVRHTRGEVA